MVTTAEDIEEGMMDNQQVIPKADIPQALLSKFALLAQL